MGASSGFKYVLPLSPLLKQLCPGLSSFPFSSTAQPLECGIGDDYPATALLALQRILSQHVPVSTLKCMTMSKASPFSYGFSLSLSLRERKM